MPNNIPQMRAKTYGRDFNFYQKSTITSTIFLGPTQPDFMITFPTQGVMFLNEDTANVVEYSFNGNTLHGELDPTKPSKAITFDNRVVSAIWFRIKAGSGASALI